MSALLAGASATFIFQGASVTLSCSSPTELKNALATFGIGGAANDTPVAKPADKPRGTTAAEAAADHAPGVKNRDGEPGNASASTSTQASAPAAASGSAPAGEQPTITYDDVKDRVLKLTKVKRELALEVLGAFKTVGGDKVDHGNKLQLPDYPAFIKAADEKLAAAGAAK